MTQSQSEIVWERIVAASSAQRPQWHRPTPSPDASRQVSPRGCPLPGSLASKMGASDSYPSVYELGDDADSSSDGYDPYEHNDTADGAAQLLMESFEPGSAHLGVSPAVLAGWFAAALASLGLGMWGLLEFTESQWIRHGVWNKEHPWTEPGGYSKANLVEAFMFVYLLPLGGVCMWVACSQLSRAEYVPVAARVAVLACVAVASVAVVVCAWVGWADRLLACKFPVLGCVSGDIDRTVETSEHPERTGFEATAGIVFIAAGLVGCAGSLLLCVRTCVWGMAAAEASMMAPPRTRNAGQAPGGVHGSGIAPNAAAPLWPAGGTSGGRLLVVVCVLVVLLPGLLAVCSMLPNNWYDFTVAGIRKFAGQNVHSDEWAFCGVDNNSICPEVPDAFFKTRTLVLSEGSADFAVGGRVVLKMFPDLVMFYSFVWALTAASALALVSRGFDRLLRRRFRVAGTGVRLTVGEAAAGTALALLLVGWCVYWFHDHNYEDVKAAERAKMWRYPKHALTKTERAARGFGQLALLLLGLLFLPASRGSVLVTSFGLNWESTLLPVHRLLGYGFLAACFAHMACYWGVFSNRGYFPHDILAWHLYYPQDKPFAQNLTAAGPWSGAKPDGDNWTVPLITVTYWLMLIAFGLLTAPRVRRAFFELFYLSHYLALPAMVGILLHASSAWYFVTPGILLWAADRATRMVRGASPVVLRSAAADCAANTVALVVQRRSRDKWLPAVDHEAGQYAFLNVPVISSSEWHPFTLSSAPEDGATTFHIRPMGPGTWTAKLYQLVRGLGGEDAGRVAVSVDGPYGTPFPVHRYKNVLLVAGGIGITPVHSIVRSLCASQERRRNARKCVEGAALVHPVSQVRVVWVTRSKALFGAFSDTLRMVEDAPETVEFKLFHTKSEAWSQSRVAAMTQTPLAPLPDLRLRPRNQPRFGRPDLRQEIEELASGGGSAAVFACGPERLTRAAEEAAAEFGVDFFKEEFLF